MTLKILPQLVLKTIKECINVFYMKRIKHKADDQIANSIGCHIHNCASHAKSGSNKRNTQRSLEFLPTLTILPVILAIHCGPDKPPPMKYTDLPIYDAPHCKYKEHQECIRTCKEQKQKIVQKSLQPYVKRYRCFITCIFGEIEDWFNYAKCLVTTTLGGLKYSMDKFLCYMRDDKNLDLRKAVVAFGAATGFVFGSKNYYVSRNFSFGILAALFTGWLCFPEETDMLIRNGGYYIGKKIEELINCFCGADGQVKFEKRGPLLPCLQDVCIPAESYSKERAVCERERLEREKQMKILEQKQMKILDEKIKEKLVEESDECLNDDVESNN